MTETKEQEKILLVGFGDIAQRLSQQLSAGSNNSNTSYTLTGVRRSAAQQDNVDFVQMDVRDEDAAKQLMKTPFDVVVITMTPDEISDEGYRRAYVESTTVLLNAIKQSGQAPRLILFVSSTSVYGQKNAEWIDEDSIAEPASYSGQRLLEAEGVLQQSQLPYCIVRFSGIYGPGRQRLIEQVVKGEGSSKEPVLYSNRIHADDCAGVLKHLIEKQKTQTIEPLYLGTDSEPVPLYDVKNWLAKQLELPENHLQEKAAGRSIRSSKRCSNQRLLNSGYQFLYPNYQVGYLSVLNDYKKNR